MKSWNNPEIIELNVTETACTGSNNGWGNKKPWGNHGWGDRGDNNGNSGNGCGSNSNWGDCDDDTDFIS